MSQVITISLDKLYNMYVEMHHCRKYIRELEAINYKFAEILKDKNIEILKLNQGNKIKKTDIHFIKCYQCDQKIDPMKYKDHIDNCTA